MKNGDGSKMNGAAGWAMVTLCYARYMYAVKT